MESKSLNAIIEEGVRLSYKISWLKKGYTDLEKRINTELANIPAMPASSISYTIREWTICNDQCSSLYYKINITLVFTEDAYLELRIGKDYDYGWEFETLYDPSIATIRAFGENLGFALAHFLDELKKRNSAHQDDIDIIGGILKKFAS